jgi:dephospho-CoA kinase
MVVVGLTGGIGSGKSTVGALFGERGAVVIDADRLARDVVAPGTPGLAEVVAEFGPGVLTEDGAMDRQAVARLVFGDEGARRRLEGIIHPRVFEEIRRLEAEAPDGAVVVHDIPLLAESGRAGSFDAVIVVDVAPETQLHRMVEDRGSSRAEGESRMAAQSSREDRLAIATYVVDNSGSLEELRARVEEVYSKLAPPVQTGGASS